MAEEFETVELEYSEDDILYYIMDEDDNEIGFALEEDGQEVEYYYEGLRRRRLRAGRSGQSPTSRPRQRCGPSQKERRVHARPLED